ncbi:hypothetical protein SAMN05421743_12829 [Thalassobacillus cyri]|uniref:Uncharacterized protein n=1 Tax=Thalassobacillus cyri TaxID=571932 RepID=A0A1H4HFZ4_9BACI|nr:hypothetical protein SAMN05421743_12829 [Thalassobacillus cyri]
MKYQNTPKEKKLKVGFTLAKMLDITAKYELEYINDTPTNFRYTATNKPLKWFVKIFMVFASEKMVTQFVERVKRVAEETYHNEEESI